MKFEILTRCTKAERLQRVYDSIIDSWKEIDSSSHSINWRIIFDTSLIDKIDAETLSTVFSKEIPISTYFWKGTPGDMGHCLLNRVMDILDPDDWMYILDDDNEMHPDFFKELVPAHENRQEVEAFIFDQYIGGKDFTGLEFREAKPENMRVQGVDMAQFLLKMKLVGDKRLVPGKYVADGIFIEDLFNQKPLKFHFINKVLCNYNHQQQPPKKSYTLPRVLVLDSLPDLKSFKAYDFESDDLNIETATNENVREKIASFDPDCIITTVDQDPGKYNQLGSLPYEFRQRWIHIDTSLPAAGEAAYHCGMHYILNADRKDLVSIFTPIYNTKEKLFRTYQSIAAQSHQNWEWVIVNDSTDNITLKIAESIAEKDPRVKVYDFKNKSKGIIGEAKYRACALTNGNYLLELDHDDYIMPFALSKMLEAFEKYPDAGFVYSDCAEIDEHYNSLTYGEGFSFGYGKYREETHMGITFKVADTSNINPLTVRHIVGVPNHFRAWKREVYFAVGGHNRRLSITDDYELVLRTFLVTKFVKIPLCCYLQFYHDSNSQNATRSDIQRRVRTIAANYNERIKARFEDLGKEDWAYNVYGSWAATPRMGDEEGYVNYIL